MEALEALRLFSGAAASLPGVAIDSGTMQAPLASPSPTSSSNTWDAALVNLLGPSPSLVSPQTFQAGLTQLDRYLATTWARAGITPQRGEDCTQAVYLTLLENLGRDRFDHLAADVGQFGIREVLSRETADGPVFFRAIDTVKKRAQRERSVQSLDQVAEIPSAQSTEPTHWRDALHEAISLTLNPRETAVIQETLQGRSPAEIAAQWGIAPKTVSNEKTRAFQKLRDFLIADLVD